MPPRVAEQGDPPDWPAPLDETTLDLDDLEPYRCGRAALQAGRLTSEQIEKFAGWCEERRQPPAALTPAQALDQAAELGRRDAQRTRVALGHEAASPEQRAAAAEWLASPDAAHVGAYLERIRVEVDADTPLRRRVEADVRHYRRLRASWWLGRRRPGRRPLRAARARRRRASARQGDSGGSDPPDGEGEAEPVGRAHARSAA